MHFNLDEAIAFAKKTTARQIYFTHMSHALQHRITQAELPEGFFLAYDGLKFNFEF